jgi:hypothetical protein
MQYTFLDGWWTSAIVTFPGLLFSTCPISDVVEGVGSGGRGAQGVVRGGEDPVLVFAARRLCGAE